MMKNTALNHSTWRLLLFALLILAGFTHAQAAYYVVGVRKHRMVGPRRHTNDRPG